MRTRFFICPAALILLISSGCRGTGGGSGHPARLEDSPVPATRLLWEEGQAREEEGDFSGALRIYRALVKDYPQSAPAGEAQFRIGVCLEKMDNLYAAFQAYQTLLDEFPGKGNLGEILRRQYEIGEVYLQGRKRWFLFLKIRSGLGRAEEIFRAVVANATFSKVSARAQYGLARSLQLRGNYLEAILEYEQVMSNYPGSEVIAPALFEIGSCYYREALRADYDQREVDDALRHLRRFVETFPDDSNRGRAEKMIGELWDRKARKAYEIARYYENKGSPDGARIYYQEVAEKYPKSKYAAPAREKLGEISGD
jgi:outer membrane assembly lipoprotein YfiO